MTGIIKIVKPGAPIDSDNPGDWIFNSNFTMPKYHSDTQHSMTINNGDLTKLISFAHGLSYVPKFKTYIGNNNFILPLPNRVVQPFTLEDKHFYSYADSTNIYIGFKTNIPFGLETIYGSHIYNSYFDNNNNFYLGRTGSTGMNGAIRFENVPVSSSDTLISAKIQMYVGFKGGSTSQHIRWNNFGIDEDNTSSFGNPFGRPRTDATSSQDRTVPTNTGDYVEIDVVSMMNEIKSRGGWSSGNAMGFVMMENNSDNDSYFGESYNPIDSYINILKQGSTTYDFRVLVFKDKIHD